MDVFGPDYTQTADAARRNGRRVLLDLEIPDRIQGADSSAFGNFYLVECVRLRVAQVQHRLRNVGHSVGLGRRTYVRCDSVLCMHTPSGIGAHNLREDRQIAGQ